MLLSHEQRIFYVQETLINKNLKELNWSTAEGIKGYFFFIGRLTFLIQIVFYVFNGVKMAIDKVFYNEASANKLGWTPEWFGCKEFDEKLVKSVRNWQKENGSPFTEREEIAFGGLNVYA